MKTGTFIKLTDLSGDHRVHKTLVYLICLAFLLANAWLIPKENYYLALLPVALAVVYLAIYRFDWIYWATLFAVPFSFPLKELAPGLGFNLLLPTEPLLAGILVIFLIRLALDGGLDRRVISHPITWIILLMIFWILITSITSTMPLVSFKYLASRLWYVVAFYFLAIVFFSDARNIRKFLWVLLIPLSFMVVVITLKHMSLGLFDQKASNPAVDPFFNDHTLYGAIMALFLPVAGGYLIRSPLSLLQKAGVLVVFILLLTGLVFSYSRAAWVSVAGAIGVMVIILFKIPGKVVILGLALTVVAFMVFGKSVLMQMERNDQDSSDNLMEHVQSISNVSTDASNLERLNRWSCALRMWAEKPLFGWGPGTYMFQYAPFQKASQKTIISTNAADGGNAHSEYLGPMSEMGLPGGLLMLALVIYSIITAVKVFHREKSAEMKMVALTVLMGLVSYYLHGILNNFLDTDKASAGLWGFLAILVALDIRNDRESVT